MKILTSLFGKRPEPEDPSTIIPAPRASPRPEIVETDEPVVQEVTQPPAPIKRVAAVNIWDLDDDPDADDGHNADADGAESEGTDGPGAVVDLFATVERHVRADAARYPAGWLVVTAGPGRGHAFVLSTGGNGIGSGAKNSVRLDFGDTEIARRNHATLRYRDTDRTFSLTMSKATDAPRVNGSAVSGDTTLADGDQIVIGSTTLQLRTFCGADFDWSDATAGTDDASPSDKEQKAAQEAVGG